MRRCLLPLALLAAPLAAGAQSDLPQSGTRYDRVADSTTWVLGRTDKVLFHGAGEHPACAARVTVLLFDSLIDFPTGTAAAARQQLLIPTPPTFRLLIDSAGTLTRAAVAGRGVEGYVGGSGAILWQYPVPDSLAARFRAASTVEGADDRNHRFRWDARKLHPAPPICGATGAP